MPITIPVDARIMEVLREYRRVGVQSATCDTLSSVLHVSRKDVDAALLRLMKAGRIGYAKKNPRFAQARYQIAGGCSK